MKFCPPCQLLVINRIIGCVSQSIVPDCWYIAYFCLYSSMRESAVGAGCGREDNRCFIVLRQRNEDDRNNHDVHASTVPSSWIVTRFSLHKHISAWCWLCQSAMQINQFDRKPSTLNFCAPGSTFIKKQWSGGLRSENWKSVWGFRLDGTCKSHFDFRFKHTTRQHCVSGSDQPSHLNKLLALTVKPLIHSGLTCHADISTAHVLSCHGEVGSRVKQSNPVGRIHLGSSSKQMFSIWSVFYVSLVKTLFFCPVSVASVTDGDGLTSHETATKTSWNVCRCPEKKTTFNATETSPRWCTDVTVS